MAPLINSTFSASRTWTTCRFCAVRRTWPRWPGIFMPRMTVPGNKRWPMAPERRCQPFAPCVRIAAAERVPADHALKAAAFGDADGIHIIARRKERRADHVAGLHFLREVAEFLDALHRPRR